MAKRRFSQVYNHSTGKYEAASLETCPRCKGFGQLCTDVDRCYVCKGKGSAWVSGVSGCTRAKYARKTDTVFY